MVDTTLPGVLLFGVAGSRPAANAVANGTLYSATDTGTVTQSDGVSTWSTFLSVSATGIPATIFDAKGDIIVASAADTAARMAAGADYTMLRWRAAATNGVEAVFPPGYELDYAEITSDASITATSEGTPNTVITGNSVTYDGTAVWVEFYTNSLRTDSGAAARSLTVFLVEDSTVKGNMAFIRTPAAAFLNAGGTFRRKLTPAAGAHTYVIKAYVSAGTGLVSAGAGGTGAGMPAYLRVVKA